MFLMVCMVVLHPYLIISNNLINFSHQAISNANYLLVGEGYEILHKFVFLAKLNPSIKVISFAFAKESRIVALKLNPSIKVIDRYTQLEIKWYIACFIFKHCTGLQMRFILLHKGNFLYDVQKKY